MANKKLCIIWKWNDLKDSELIYRLIPVEGIGDQAIQIHENKLDFVNDWIDSFCDSELTHPQTELIVLCHFQNGAQASKLKMFISKCKEKCNAILLNFGGGTDFLYYHKEGKTGLINQTGGFQNGYLLGIKNKVSVLNGEKILYDSFQKVWNYYSLNKYKEPIYTYLREKLLLEMFATKFSSPIRTWLEQVPDDARGIMYEFIIGDHPMFKQNEFLMDRQLNLRQARENLIKLLDEPSPEALEVRKITEDLLKNIPGQIY